MNDGTPADGGATNSSSPIASLAATVDLTKVLFQAAKDGDAEFLKELLDSDPLGVHATDPEGWQPLHFAAHAGQTAALQLLLDFNADPHASKGDCSTALHDAAYQGSEEICAALLERKVDINQADEDGWSALHFAAASGHAGVVSLLLQQKADVAAKTRDSKTAFKLAFAEGHRNVLEVLEEKADMRGDKAELQGAASVRIAELEEELARVLAEKQELQEALLRKDGKELPKDEATEEAKEADAKKKRKKPKKKEKAEGHEQAADALDSSLQSFSSNAENLEKLIHEKRAEMEEAESTQFGPEDTEVYHERMMELYSLKADAVTIIAPRSAPLEGECAVVLSGEYHHLPVSCVVVNDVLYHPYFKDRLAREVAFIATVAHPHLAVFTGICFQKRFGESEAARRKKAQQPASEEPPPLPYADLSTKDYEICLVYERHGEPLQALLSEEGFALRLSDIAGLMLGLATAVAHIHHRGHVHNAISSSTVVVERRGMAAKLTHFGVAATANVFRKGKVPRGSVRWYCAPEQLDPAPKKGAPPSSQLYDFGSPKQDVYGLGMVLLALCTMKEDNGKPADLAKGIKASGLRDLVYLMTKPRPEDRPTAEEVAAQLAALRKLPEFA